MVMKPGENFNHVKKGGTTLVGHKTRYFVCRNRLINSKLVDEKCPSLCVNARVLEFLVTSKFLIELFQNPKATLKDGHKWGTRKQKFRISIKN